MRASLRRLFGLLTLAAFLGSLALPLLPATHFDWNDDTACGAVGLAGSRGDRVSTIPASSAPRHCELCHWLRAMGSAAPSDMAATGVPVEADRLRPITAADAPDLLLSGSRQSRGPPAVSL
jgi:hypothetical protein